jgi:hypothetical protein
MFSSADFGEHNQLYTCAGGSMNEASPPMLPPAYSSDIKISPGLEN